MNQLKWQIAQWFELRWWKHYLHGKDKTEYLKWKRSYWNRVLDIVSREISIDSSLAIADIGCGPAGIFIALPQSKVTAVDPLLDKYEAEISFFKKEDYPNVAFVNSTIESFTPSQKYDLVFCLNCINHVSDFDAAMNVLGACVSNDKHLVMSIDAHNHSFFKHLFRVIPGDVLHPHQYNLREYESHLTKKGIKILKTELMKREFFFNHHLIVAQKAG